VFVWRARQLQIISSRRRSLVSSSPRVYVIVLYNITYTRDAETILYVSRSIFARTAFSSFVTTKSGGEKRKKKMSFVRFYWYRPFSLYRGARVYRVRPNAGNNYSNKQYAKETERLISCRVYGGVFVFFFVFVVNPLCRRVLRNKWPCPSEIALRLHRQRRRSMRLERSHSRTDCTNTSLRDVAL